MAGECSISPFDPSRLATLTLCYNIVQDVAGDSPGQRKPLPRGGNFLRGLVLILVRLCAAGAHGAGQERAPARHHGDVPTAGGGGTGDSLRDALD